MSKKQTKKLNELEKKVNAFSPNSKYPHDKFILITLQEAIAALKEGNWGVGAILVDKNGEIIQRGHNRLFSPCFRSDLHTEMDVLDKFEEQICLQRQKEGALKGKGFTLYLSLESCPMCLFRLLTAGIDRVYHAIPDPDGGGLYLLNNLPHGWRSLARGQKFALADISPELRELARQTEKIAWTP